MTYATYNLTPHTQLSIRGTTGSQPNSRFVFGIYMDYHCFVKDEYGPLFSQPECAYNDMDWSEAVKMAKWILEQDEWMKEWKE